MSLYLFKLFFFLDVLGLRCHVGFSVVAAGGGCPPVAVFMLLMAVASLIAERRLQGAGLP